MRILMLSAALMSACIATAQQLPAPATQSATDPLDQAITLLRKQGAPATFEDLKPAPIADAKNGALDIDKATTLLSSDNCGPSSSALEYGEQLPYPPEWFALAQRNAQFHAEAASLLHRARGKGETAWPAPTAPFSDWLKTGMGSLSRYRELANVSADIALYQHFTGDDLHAVQSLRGLEFLGTAISRKPFLVAKLVSIGIWAKQAHAVQVVSTGLKCAPPPEPTGAFLREETKALIADLLDDTKVLNSYRAAVREERTILIEEIRNGQYSNVPYARAELPASIAAYDALVSAADKRPWEPVNISAGVTMQTLIPSMERVRGSVWKIIALRRMAAVSLAYALYRNDQGRVAPDLQSLVPAYLANVPADPFARDGSAFRYVILENSARPLIGSVGPDGQPGPPGLHKTPSYCQNAQRGEPDDLWLDLSAWRP